MSQWIALALVVVVSMQVHAAEVGQTGDSNDGSAAATAAAQPVSAPDMTINRTGLSDKMKEMGAQVKTLFLGLIKNQPVSDADLKAAASKLEALALECPAKAPSHMIDSDGHVKPDQMNNFLAFHEMMSKLPGLVTNLKKLVNAGDKAGATTALKVVLDLQKAGHENFKQ